MNKGGKMGAKPQEKSFEEEASVDYTKDSDDWIDEDDLREDIE